MIPEFGIRVQRVSSLPQVAVVVAGLIWPVLVLGAVVIYLMMTNK